MDTFEIRGSIDGVARIISWVDGSFEDPSGRVAQLIAEGVPWPVTPTGPEVVPAARPAESALITALSAFDDRLVTWDDAAEAIWVGWADEALAAPDGAAA